MAIRVGCCISLTGSFATQGRQAERGLRLWVEDVNAAGGLRVRDRGGPELIELVLRDDASRASRAARLAEELIVGDRVNLIFGPYSSATSLAVAEVAEVHRKVLWNHGGSSDALVQRGFRYIVNVPSPAGRYFSGILDLTRAMAPELSRLLLLYDPAGTFASAVTDGAERHARQNGFDVLGKKPYPADGDFTTLAAEVAAMRPDVLLAAGRLRADIALVRALVAAGLAVPIVGLIAAGVAEFGAELGTAANGIFGPSQWEPGARTQTEFGPAAAEFVEHFRARFAAEPDYPAAQAYAAGLVLQRAVERAGTLRDEALREEASALRLRTFYGGFRLDPVTGEQTGHELVTVQWQDGARRVVWPAEVAEATPRLSL